MKDKTKLTDDGVRHIAKLANLTLTEDEVKKLQKQLSETLDYIKVLDELDTSKIEPTSQVTGLKKISREDKVKSSLSQKEALSSSFSVLNGFFRTKGVLEK